jgi:hypothetical protein
MFKVFLKKTLKNGFKFLKPALAGFVVQCCGDKLGVTILEIL